jgi:predicted nuclease of predicted toxin-antitoxin system
MARLYADENFPLPVVEELRKLGHDVLTAHEAGNTGKQLPDEDVLAFAVKEERLLLTLNRKHLFAFMEKSPIILASSCVPLTHNSWIRQSEFMPRCELNPRWKGS